MWGMRSLLDPFPTSVWASRQGALAVWEGRVVLENCLQVFATPFAPDVSRLAVWPSGS